MAGHPARNLSVRCAVDQSGRVMYENSQRDSPTAMTTATWITARLPPQCSKNMRGRHDNHRRFEVPATHGLDPLRVVGCAGAQCQKCFAVANGFAVEAIRCREAFDRLLLFG